MNAAFYGAEGKGEERKAEIWAGFPHQRALPGVLDKVHW